jgi:hypothetical protein
MTWVGPAPGGMPEMALELVVAYDDERFTPSEKVEGAEHGLAVIGSFQLTSVDHAGSGKRSHRDLPVRPHHDGGPGQAV